MGYLIWLLILNLVAFISGLALTTSNSYDQQIWIITIEICLVINLFSIVCAMLPTK